MTLDEAIERKTQEFRQLTDQLQAAKAFIEDKIADIKRVEQDLIVLNATKKMLTGEPCKSGN